MYGFTYLSLEVVAVPFGSVMELLLHLVVELLVARVARQNRHLDPDLLPLPLRLISSSFNVVSKGMREGESRDNPDPEEQPFIYI